MTPSPTFPLPQTTRTRPLALAVLAYVSAVSASVGAVATVVGAGLPLELLLAVA